MNKSIITKKKQLLCVLERVFGELDNIERDATCSWTIIGKETSQAKDWKTGELLYEDDGSPLYRDKYGYVPSDEISEEEQFKVDAVNEIRKSLEKLI